MCGYGCWILLWKGGAGGKLGGGIEKKREVGLFGEFLK